MPRLAALGPAYLVALALSLAAPPAQASARQLHGGVQLGGARSWGDAGAWSGTLGLHGGYGLSDAWRLYGNLEYGLGVVQASTASLQHRGALSVGVAYTLDVAELVPWVGVGVQGMLISIPGGVAALPAAEARGGVDWLLSRYFGLTAQLAYAFPFANRALVSDVLTATVGLRFTVDL